ncbi:MAG: cation transporter [Chloroflexi bacterium]|nr:cation transporter [Chloroflexota bacterium]
MPETPSTPAGHSHGHSAANAGRSRLLIVLALVVAFLVVEIIGSVLTNSLALLADAGHMLTDAVGVGLALLAIHFAARPATANKSFGYYRLEILAAVGNAVLLFGVAAYILFEAYQRFGQPPEVQGIPMLAVAAVGLVVNLVSVRLLSAGAQTSLNMRGAYLEVLGDLLGSVAVLIAGLIILTTGWTLADPIASVLIALLILPRTWSLLREAIDVLLQATPKGVDLAEVRAHLLRGEGIVDALDLHAWTLTCGMHVVSAHVVIEPTANAAEVLDEVCRCLSDDFDMEHSTIQLETTDRRRLEEGGHA